MTGVLLVCDVCDDPVDYEAAVVEVETGTALTVGLCEATWTSSIPHTSGSVMASR